MSDQSRERPLPPLPEPGIGFPWRMNAQDGSVHCSAFTADQLREYVLADRRASSEQAAQWLIDVRDSFRQMAEQANGHLTRFVGDSCASDSLSAFEARIREECAKVCERKVRRGAGHGGRFEGYGPFEELMNGNECASAIRSLREGTSNV